MDDPRLPAINRRAAEASVRRAVDIELIGGKQELMLRDVGARLAAEYHRLKTSVSPVALGAAWRAAR